MKKKLLKGRFNFVYVFGSLYSYFSMDFEKKSFAEFVILKPTKTYLI